MANEAWDEVAFWLQVIHDSERTVICNPDMESRIHTGLQARGVTNVTVKATPICPPGIAYVVDEQALMADINRTQKPRLFP